VQLLLTKILIAIEQANLNLPHSILHPLQNLELPGEIGLMEKDLILFLLRLLQSVYHVLHSYGCVLNIEV
jgi:hypothetical protein